MSEELSTELNIRPRNLVNGVTVWLAHMPEATDNKWGVYADDDGVPTRLLHSGDSPNDLIDTINAEIRAKAADRKRTDPSALYGTDFYKNHGVVSPSALEATLSLSPAEKDAFLLALINLHGASLWHAYTHAR